jgi:hypothetical protein
MSTLPSDPNIRAGLPSASALARLLQCPGSQNLINSIPREAMDALRPKADDEVADRGTLIHAAREKLSDADLDAEDAAIYQQGTEYERKIVEKWMEDGNLSVADITEGPRENRLWICDADGNRLGSGQLDVHYLAPGKGLALVIDWKALWATHVPKAKASAQLRFQAVGLWQNHPEYTQIRVAYVRAMLPEAMSVNDRADYSLQDLEYSLHMIRYQAWLAKQPEAPRAAGAECDYCPAKAWCREGGAWAMLPSVDLRQDGTVSVMAPDPDELVAKMTPEDLRRVWQMGPLVAKIIKGATARLKAFPAEQLFALGLEVGKGSKLDPIVRVREAAEFLLSQGYTAEEVWGCLGFSKGDLGELVMNHEGIAKKHAPARVGELLAEFIEPKRSEGSLQLFKGLK